MLVIMIYFVHPKTSARPGPPGRAGGAVHEAGRPNLSLRGSGDPSRAPSPPPSGGARARGAKVRPNLIRSDWPGADLYLRPMQRLFEFFSCGSIWKFRPSSIDD